MADTLPEPSAPFGRRANRLSAPTWGALVDVDPRLSEGLLDRLEAGGVAAYVEPASAVDTVSRAVTMPVRPLDRLWVDPARADSAREIVASEVAELSALLAEQDPSANAAGLVHPVPRSAGPRVLAPPPLPGPARPGPHDSAGARPTDGAAPGASRPSDDEVFAQLVEQFQADPGAPGQARPWPAREDLPAPGDAPRRRRTDPPGGPALGPAPAAAPDAEPRPGPGGRPPLGGRTETGSATGTPVRPVSWGLPGGARRIPPPGAPTSTSSGPGAGPGGGAGHPGRRGPENRHADAGRDGLDDLDDPDDHFVPPAPPPVPRVRPRTLGATLAVLLGLLVLFDPELLRLPATLGVGLIGLALLAGGATALVWWMQDGADDDDGDGAVV